MTDKILEVKNLTKAYNGFYAVKSINFDLRRAEIFGFLGPNGAGKTTTINMLTGMAKVTSGKIFFNGSDLTNNITKAQEIIGLVPDESNLYDEMSGFDNLCFCGALYGMLKKERQQRAGELLEIFQLSDVAAKKYKAYSKGMKRKLTIAAALMHSPEILFLDEPTTGIDVMNVRQIRKLIRKLNEKGTSIFLTTHYIEEAERLCDRVAFIQEGEIIRTGTVDFLIEESRVINSIEIRLEQPGNGKKKLLDNLRVRFPGFESVYVNDNIIRISSTGTIDIAPVVSYLSEAGLLIYEARLIKPSLEDAFVRATGIEISSMKKEKERK
ncbi:MAG: ABC transporter ATP-binding protein [Bacteroidales bacterium]|nr:ABC transporter ATP-binding protein [Bacteroidales bacterium]